MNHGSASFEAVAETSLQISKPSSAHTLKSHTHYTFSDLHHTEGNSVDC